MLLSCLVSSGATACSHRASWWAAPTTTSTPGYTPQGALSTTPSTCLSIYIHIFLTIHLFVYLSIWHYLFVYSSICQTIHIYTYISFSIYLSIWLSIHLSIYLYIYLSIYRPINIYSLINRNDSVMVAHPPVKCMARVRFLTIEFSAF